MAPPIGSTKPGSGPAIGVRVRPVEARDVRAIAAIDAAHSGRQKRRWWDEVVARHLRRVEGVGARIGLVAVEGEGAKERVVGYAFGQVRAFEFGSEPCGWVYAIGVDRRRLRTAIGSTLLARVREWFAGEKVGVVRTMVRRDDVAVLTFFRSHGFALGPFVELEKTLEEGRA